MSQSQISLKQNCIQNLGKAKMLHLNRPARLVLSVCYQGSPFLWQTLQRSLGLAHPRFIWRLTRISPISLIWFLLPKLQLAKCIILDYSMGLDRHLPLKPSLQKWIFGQKQAQLSHVSLYLSSSTNSYWWFQSCLWKHHHLGWYEHHLGWYYLKLRCWF